MKRRFFSFAGMLALGTIVMAGCAEEQTTKAPAPTAPSAEAQAPKAETATNAVTPEVAKPTTERVAQVANTVANKIDAIKGMGAICSLSGAAGSSIDCAVRLASSADGVAARALQGTLLFDADAVSFEGFFEEFCPAGGSCVNREITAEAPNLSGSGHILSFAPKAKSEWAGRGSFLIANLSNPQAAITEAQTGTDAAAKGVFTARFSLKKDISADSAAVVEIGNVVAADAAAQEIAVRVTDATIVTGDRKSVV